MSADTLASHAAPLFTNDAVVLGLLMGILGFVFWSSNSEAPLWKKFYSIVPALLMCYFLPSVLTSFNIISPEESKLYFVASRYLLPTSLVLLTLSIDFKGLIRLGPKALIMFFTGSIGIIVGGPIALLVASWISPELVGSGPDSIWRGMTTVAGSWIGGSANQLAMKEMFKVDDAIFSVMVAVDVIVANIWMACLLFAAGRSDAIDARIGADNSAITVLKQRMQAYQEQTSRIPALKDTMLILAVGFGATAIAHIGSDIISPWLKGFNSLLLERLSLTSPFFWLVVIATTVGMLAAATPLRKLEGAGASRVGSALLYVLIASIGMNMDIRAVKEHVGLFLIGLLWMAVHATLLIVVAKLIKAPVFFLAVGSQANVGGAASAPVVASAFHPSLASVGVLLAVFGYAFGTLGAWFCGQLLRIAAGG
jgi:uncharacterized membrane protein